VLRFRGLERELAAAREAARAGRLDAAVQAYRTAIASSPGSPFLHRELAAIERQRGNVDGAIEQFRQAAALDPSDAGSLADVAMLLEARGDLQGALQAYNESLAIESSAPIEASRNALRDRMELLSLPAEYRAIESAPQTTRADLAALIGVRLGPLLQTAQASEPIVITDVRMNWAESWILAVARAGVIEPFANHTFQPAGIVRRADLAQAVVRLLPRVALAEQNKSWQDERRTFSDLSRGHLAYPAAAVAVASGVMAAGPDDSFQPSRPVTGAEAVAAIGRLQALAGPRVARGAGGR
jgi:tetratricopeptide (TPR) repeat protein